MAVSKNTKVITIKVQKFGPHSVASENTEELRKQKSNRKGWILFCKWFQIAAFMCEEKSFHVNARRSNRSTRKRALLTSLALLRYLIRWPASPWCEWWRSQERLKFQKKVPSILTKKVNTEYLNAIFHCPNRNTVKKWAWLSFITSLKKICRREHHNRLWISWTSSTSLRGHYLWNKKH